MGHYMSLRVKLRPKQEFAALYQFIFDNAEEYPSTWAAAAEKFPDFAFVKDWAAVRRCEFIPFGALTCADWDDDDPEWSLAFDEIFQFQCSLKNYKNEIETWFELFKHTWVAIDGWIYSEDWAKQTKIENYLDI